MEGIGYFTHETLRHITRSHPDIDFYFLFDRQFSSEFIYDKNVKPVVLFPPARHPFLWFWWFEFSVFSWLSKNKPDLFLSPDGYCSLRAGTPTVVVMHDIAFEHFPEQVPLVTGWYYKFFMPRFAKRADRVATVSEYSKKDIQGQYHIDDEKVDVVYSAAKDFFHPASDLLQKETRLKYCNGEEYFVYVGSINGRKNVKNMVLAFDQFKLKTKSPMKFLIAGAVGWKNEEMSKALKSLQYREDVIFTGRLNETELQNVIASAFAVMYVSLFEGFGVPPLEAMKCEVPCIASTTSSMPEITGGAALLAQPNIVEDISEKMERLYNSKELREELIANGKIRSAEFTWKRTAELLWNTCETVLKQKQ